VVALAGAAPLVWVHLRATYVDLPVGLLGLALLAALLQDRPPLSALLLAMVLAAVKDEGLGHVIAACLAAFAVRRVKVVALPLFAALVTVATWRWLLRAHAVEVFDHALGVPEWRWGPRLAQLLWLHATDVFSWGVFWPVVLAVSLRRAPSSAAWALRWLVVLDLLAISAAVLSGPERVRVFAENGTLLNRLLMQTWPAAVVLLWLGLEEPRPTT
jgi:hypothetical protein